MDVEGIGRGQHNDSVEGASILINNRMRGHTALGALLVYAALALALLAVPSTAIGVVSIDYGTEWIKAALIKPGKPFDLVLSRDSKRKVQASVAFKGAVPDDGALEKQERIMGADAYAYASRSPYQSFHAAKLLLGQSCRPDEPEAVAQYRAVFGNLVARLPDDLKTGSTCVVAPSLNTTSYWRAEEIVGMQLDHIRELAEETAGELLSIGYQSGSSFFSSQRGLDTVITVPIFYTPHERQALLDAAVLAGFRPRLISDAAAAATNYAQSRTFPKPERHIFYDAGSGSVRASLVEFSTPENSTKPGSVVVQVLDAAWDRTAGGLSMDMLLRDMLADAFDAAYPERASVKKDARAMARLLREANRAKHVLSANAAATVYVESLADDLDLRTTIDRETFETKMHKVKLLERFISPLSQLLKRNKITIDDVQSVVLVGGATRVPSVQAQLKALGIPDEKLAQNVNADEAAVMGAALAVASTQPQLRMKHVDVHDGNMYPVDLSVSGHESTIFPSGPVFAEAYELTLNGQQTDFDILLSSPKDRLERGDAGELQRIRVDGVADALADLQAKNEMSHVDVKVNLTVRNAPFGTYHVPSAALTVTPHKSITGTIKSLFHFSSSDNATNTTTEADALAPQSTVLSVNTTYLGPVRPLTGLEKIKSLERLRLIVYEAKQRAERDAAMNSLESVIYRARDQVETDAFAEAAAKHELDAIRAKTDELHSWLNDQSDGANAEAITKRERELTKQTDAVLKRQAQAERRPTAIADLSATLSSAQTFLREARANLTQAMAENMGSKYTASDLDSLESTVKKDLSWLEDGRKAQQKRKAHEDPVLLVEDMDRRGKKIRDTMTKLQKRRIPKTRPKMTHTSSSSASSSSSSSASATMTPSTSSSTPAEATSTPDVPVHDDL